MRGKDADHVLASHDGARQDYEKELRQAEHDSKRIQTEEHLDKFLIRQAKLKGITPGGDPRAERDHDLACGTRSYAYASDRDGGPKRRDRGGACSTDEDPMIVSSVRMREREVVHANKRVS